MKSARTEGCHVGLFREFVGTACCTYGQSNTTIGLINEECGNYSWMSLVICLQ